MARRRIGKALLVYASCVMWDQWRDGHSCSKSNNKKKNNLKKSNKSKKKMGSATGNEVADRLFGHFEKHKEVRRRFLAGGGMTLTHWSRRADMTMGLQVFFTIRLVTQQSALTLNSQEIKDPDPLMASEMMDGRDTFLTRAREEHWEFRYACICVWI
jgi:E1A/CREB-binding protein